MLRTAVCNGYSLYLHNSDRFPSYASSLVRPGTTTSCHSLLFSYSYILQCNPGLSNLISETLQIPKGVFLKDLYKLEGLLKYVDNPTFQKKWAAIKQSNKERLAHYVETTLGFKINTHAMFDVQIKVRLFSSCTA